MQVKFSKEFQKEYLKQSGKVRQSLLKSIEDVLKANTPEDIANCKKLAGLKNVYRIRIGDFRAFFTFYVILDENQAHFIALIHRGQAYDKKAMKRLRKSDSD